jgi:hypothetical protein
MRKINPSYLTLSEAASYISEQLEEECTSRDVLALGEWDRLQVCAPTKHDLNFEPFDYELLEAIGVSVKSVGFVNSGQLLFLNKSNISDLLAHGRTEIVTLVRLFSERTNIEAVKYLREVGVLQFGCPGSPVEIADCRLAHGDVELYIRKERNYRKLVENEAWEDATKDSKALGNKDRSASNKSRANINKDKLDDLDYAQCHKQSGWYLDPSPKELPNIRLPLYEFLKEAHLNGEPKPNATNVMRHWQDNPPSIVREVMDSEVKYYLGDGKLVSIMKKALQQRIKRLTTPPKKP